LGGAERGAQFELTRLIYIGGYGHSGSTLIEYLMTGSPEVLACGEVASCIRAGAVQNRKCSCGREAETCPVWHFFCSPSSRSVSWTHARLLHALVQQAGADFSAILDSSKTAWGSFSIPFRLKRQFGSEFMLVHLVRDPAAVCWSVLKQKDHKAAREERSVPHYLFRCSWMVVGWYLANLSSELFGLIYSRHYVRIRYEDLVREPAKTLSALFVRLLPGADWSAEGLGARDNRHQLHGNKARRRHILIEDVKEDLRWKPEMPPEYLRVVHTLSYLLRLRYGYSKRPSIPERR
jgi:hypothetical protein